MGMTIEKYRQLREALENAVIFDRRDDIKHEVGRAWDTSAAIKAAARQTLDRWQECDCFGGFVLSGGKGGKRPCPDCGGSGLLPNQARLGAVARAVGMADVPDYGSSQQEHYDRLAEAAVRAFDKETP